MPVLEVPTPGLLILIDVRNLEISASQLNESPTNPTTPPGIPPPSQIPTPPAKIDYHRLISIIATNAHTQPQRPLAKSPPYFPQPTLAVTGYHYDLPKYAGVMHVTPPVRPNRPDKPVDHVIVRKMTEEYMRLQYEALPEPGRTFCLVAGDGDFVDVVSHARQAGCNVEQWFWTKSPAWNTMWRAQESMQSLNMGSFSINDLGPFYDYLTNPNAPPPTPFPSETSFNPRPTVPSPSAMPNSHLSSHTPVSSSLSPRASFQPYVPPQQRARMQQQTSGGGVCAASALHGEQSSGGLTVHSASLDMNKAFAQTSLNVSDGGDIITTPSMHNGSHTALTGISTTGLSQGLQQRRGYGETGAMYNGNELSGAGCRYMDVGNAPTTPVTPHGVVASGGYVQGGGGLQGVSHGGRGNGSLRATPTRGMGVMVSSPQMVGMASGMGGGTLAPGVLLGEPALAVSGRGGGGGMMTNGHIMNISNYNLMNPDSMDNLNLDNLQNKNEQSNQVVTSTSVMNGNGGGRGNHAKTTMTTGSAALASAAVAVGGMVGYGNGKASGNVMDNAHLLTSGGQQHGPTINTGNLSRWCNVKENKMIGENRIAGGVSGGASYAHAARNGTMETTKVMVGAGVANSGNGSGSGSGNGSGSGEVGGGGGGGSGGENETSNSGEGWTKVTTINGRNHKGSVSQQMVWREDGGGGDCNVGWDGDGRWVEGVDEQGRRVDWNGNGNGFSGSVRCFMREFCRYGEKSPSTGESVCQFLHTEKEIAWWKMHGGPKYTLGKQRECKWRESCDVSRTKHKACTWLHPENGEDVNKPLCGICLTMHERYVEDENGCSRLYDCEQRDEPMSEKLVAELLKKGWITEKSY